MKSVVGHYGVPIIAVFAVILIVAIFDSDWLMSGLKTIVDIPGEDYTVYTDAPEIERILTTPKPVLALKDYTVEEDTFYNLKEVFMIKDFQGNELDFEILSLTDSAGADIMTGNDMTYYKFGSPGKYTVSVLATDMDGITIRKVLTFPVQAK